jgi:hypothetical protein
MSVTAITDRAAEASTYIATIATVTFWGLSISEIAVTFSAIVAGMSFAVHLWASIRRDRREERQLRILTGEEDGLFDRRTPEVHEGAEGAREQDGRG